MDVLRGAITRIGDPSTLRLESGKSNIQWKSLYEFFMMHNDLLATIERIAIFDCCNAGAAFYSKIVPRHKEPCNRKGVYEFRGNNCGSEPFALHVDITGLKPLVLPVAKRKSSLPKQAPLSKPQSVLVELSVSGEPSRGFQEVVRTLPPDFRITIIDACENVIELHVIGVVTGTSLLPVATSQPLPNMPLANLTNRQRDYGKNK
ncbi:hypothetical protein V8E54_005014 [Elaphomyces granulatus]